MGPGARPAVMRRSRDHSRTDRVQFHVPNRCPEMRNVQRGRKEAVGPLMTGNISSLVPDARICPVCVANSLGNRVLHGSDHDQMHMVRHQAVGPDGHPELTRVATEQSQVLEAIIIVTEYDSSLIASVGDVERTPWHHDSCCSRHGNDLGEACLEPLTNVGWMFNERKLGVKEALPVHRACFRCTGPHKVSPKRRFGKRPGVTCV